MNPVKPVIAPTIGRRVLLFVAVGAIAHDVSEKDSTPSGEKDGTPSAMSVVNHLTVPFDAGIAYAHSADQPEMNRINVGYTDHVGAHHNLTSVALYDRPQNDNDGHGKENYAVWMPYQYQQALRALEGPKFPPAQDRPADVPLRKLVDNGVEVQEAEDTQDDIARASSEGA